MGKPENERERMQRGETGRAETARTDDPAIAVGETSPEERRGEGERDGKGDKAGKGERDVLKNKGGKAGKSGGKAGKKLKKKSARLFTLVLSDTDNDLHSVKYTLWIAGVCNKNGHWRKGVRNIRVVHTGDWLNKWNPQAEVLDFFQDLKNQAPKTCEVVMLVGNHEVEILKRSEMGIRTGLAEHQLAFIREQEMMYVSGKTLYLHGYPSFHLLRLLKQIKEEKAGLNAFNKRMRKAFYEGRYALFKEKEGLEIVGDIRRVKQYYIRPCGDEPCGRKMGRLLEELKIKTIIHGHRPNFITQIDDELRIELPGVRVINNDTRTKSTGLGAAIVDKLGRVMFVNLKEMYWAGGEKKFRKKIRKILGTD